MPVSSTPADLVQTIVDKRLRQLQRDCLANHSTSVAALARLRRGVGKPPGSVLDILEYTHAPEFVDDWLDDKATEAETAAHVSMTLYAVHQQSQSQGMHQQSHRLGRSLRRLVAEPEVRPDQAVARRFAMLGTADSLDELVHHLRGVVQLLRAGQIPLDYGLLAGDLVRWQRCGGPASVRLRWGRDFHFAKQTTTP